MCPQNHGLEKDFPFNYGHFWCVGASFPVIFRAEVMPKWICLVDYNRRVSWNSPFGSVYFLRGN